MARGQLEQQTEQVARRRAQQVVLWQRLRGHIAGRPKRYFFAALTLLYILTASYNLISIDVLAAEEPARNLALHGTLDLSAASHSEVRWYFQHNGGLFSDRFPGAILYLVPAYWLAHALGVPDYSYVPGAVTAAVVAASAVLVLHNVYLRILQSARVTWTATLFTGLGTGVWSLAAHAPWSHTLDLLFIALALLALSSGRRMTAGLWLGMAVATRPTMAVAALAIGVTLAVSFRSLVPLIKVGMGCLPGTGLLFIYNGLLFDRWGPSNGHELRGEIAVSLADLPLNVLGALFSPTRGLVLFYPILLLAAIGAYRAWRAATNWERASLVAGVAVLLTQLSLDQYTGGDAFFGPRLVIEPLALASPFLARSVTKFGQRHGSRSIPWFLGAGIAIHGLGGTIVHVAFGY